MTIPTLAFDSIDSTMLEAERQAAAGARGPLVICAGAQTGGQGRLGRRWTSPPGSLYWTMLLTDPADRPRDAGLAFAAGLAVIDALAALGVRRDRLRLKWPNDVLLDACKVAGLLVNASVTGTAVHTVVGIGINVASFPTETRFPATSLAAAGLPAPAIEAVRDILTDCFLRRRGAWHAAGLGPLRAEVVGCLHGVGSVVTVSLGRDRTLAGVCQGLDPTGALLLATPDGAVQTVIAGDVMT